ncbi:MAG: hypothetical protein HQL50_05760 [Magnetococcales bacterium]|nr:hypothetical protein [Magnetococcales bacterium]
MKQTRTSSPSSDQLTQDYLSHKQHGFRNAVLRATRLFSSGPPFLTGPDAVHPVFEEPLPLLEPFVFLYAWHWLRREVFPTYIPTVLAASRNPQHAYVTSFLQQAESDTAFLVLYYTHWQTLARKINHRDPTLRALPDQMVETAEKTACFVDGFGTIEKAVRHTLTLWTQLGYFISEDQKAIRQIQAVQKSRTQEILGEEDQERLSLIDQLPNPDSLSKEHDTDHPFQKMGFIPRLPCPQSCRHCLFVWRPKPTIESDPSALLDSMQHLAPNLLFTGGDLTQDLPLFCKAISQMQHVSTFAILLNGTFAATLPSTKTVFRKLTQALKSRPVSKNASVQIQISFDEIHQEILCDRHGRLHERIPLSNIANIIETATQFPMINLSLLHKQNAFNFSNDLFKKGVFGRLVRALAKRGHQVRILSTAPSPTPKRHPAKLEMVAPVIRDAMFTIENSAAATPIHFMSSTIDAYGRAQRVDPSEYINDKERVRSYMDHRGTHEQGEGFDSDPMVATDGVVTLFSAIHYTLGNAIDEGWEVIKERHHKDPLLKALACFDYRLMTAYADSAEDLPTLVHRSTSLHHLFHQMTRNAKMRLEMTRWLLNR